jgi:hypothetical protein
MAAPYRGLSEEGWGYAPIKDISARNSPITKTHGETNTPMTPKTTEQLRNEVLAIGQDLRDGKISNAVAQAQLREASKALRKLRNCLTSGNTERAGDEASEG